MNFKQQYLTTLVKHKRVLDDDRLDYFEETWHNSNQIGLTAITLQEALGLNYTEYSLYLKQPAIFWKLMAHSLKIIRYVYNNHFCDMSSISDEELIDIHYKLMDPDTISYLDDYEDIHPNLIIWEVYQAVSVFRISSYLETAIESLQNLIIDFIKP